MTIRIGTRGSKLALWQAYHIENLLQQAGFSTEVVIIQTTGDKILDRSLSKIGSKGVFTEEIEESLRNGSIDIAVHSAKDMQATLPDDLELMAFAERETANDVMVSELPSFSLDKEGTVIGTSSVRRTAFLRHHFPHLKIVDMRGNLQTRLAKHQNGDCDALLLAYAGVHRMGYHDKIVHQLPIEQFTPPVGQGSVTIECCPGKMEASVYERIREAINHPETEKCLLAERSFLKTLQGGCSIPAFGHAQNTENGVSLTAGLIATDGRQLIKYSETAADGVQLGHELAVKVLENGGKAILEAIRSHS